MATCPNCGAILSKKDTVCGICGAALQSSGSSRSSRPHGGGKPRIFVIVLAIVAILGAVSVGAANLLIPSEKLDRAIQKTSNAFLEQIEAQSQLDKAYQTMQSCVANRKFSMFIDANTDVVMNASMNYNGARKTMDGNLQFGGSNSDRVIEYYFDKKIVQFALPAITQDTYGFALKDLQNSTVGSALSRLISLGDMQNLPEEPFSVLETKSESLQKTWSRFWKIVDVETRTKQNGETSYTVSWNTAELSKLLLEDAPGLLSEPIMNILSEIDGSCVCYVNKKGYLYQVDALVAGDLFTFELSGKDNPWESFSLRSTLGNQPLFSGEVCSDAGGLHIGFYDAENQNAVFQIEYDNATSALQITAGDYWLEGRLQASKESVDLTIYTEDGGEYSLQFSHLLEKPDKITRDYVDLLSLNGEEAARLLIQIGANSEVFQECYESFVQYLGMLFSTND